MRGQPLVLFHDGEAGEVDARERAEIQNRAVRDAVAHRLEQALELAPRARADGRDDRQRTLVRHGCGGLIGRT